MRSKATGSGFAKLGRGLLAAVGAAAVALAVAPGTALAADSVPMYRLYNQWSGEHLFTTDASEYNSLSGIGWSKEGIAWEAPSEGTTVYRLYNPYSGDHFYTSSASEYARLGSIGWNQEGTAFHSGGNKPIYRLFNRWLTAGTHLFTTDKGEYDNLTSAGWSGENVAFYGVENGGAEQKAPASQPQVTKSQQNAVTRAKSYLSWTNFSRQGLIDQLEFEKFSTDDATYGVDHCGANWDDQAMRKAKSYLEYSSFSRQGLIDQLKFDKFTDSQAVYATDHSGANWTEQADKKAAQYVKNSGYSRQGLMDQLEFDGFTPEQAQHGVSSVGY